MRKIGKNFSPRKKVLFSEMLKKQEEILKEINNISIHVLDIGCGRGEFSKERACDNLNKNYFNIDIFTSGLVSLYDFAQSNKLTNIFALQIDIHKFIPMLLESLDKRSSTIEIINILYPDPWPKMKHRKRRIVNREFLNQLYDIMKDNGMINIATDFQDYYEDIIELLRNNNKFTIIKNEECLPENKTVELPYTNFEKKSNGNCFYIVLQKSKCKEIQ